MNKPLSPHLSIYKFKLSLLMSIAHRITGGALYMSMLIFTVFLISLTMGEKYYALYSFIAGSWLGKLAIIGITWAIFHHMFAATSVLPLCVARSVPERRILSTLHR